jgi:hypothetical protein
MDRRNFLLGILGVAGAAGATAAFMPKAEAAPLLDQLKGMDAGTVANPLADAADLPAEGAQETQFYYRRRGYYRRPFVYRRRFAPVYRRRCTVFRNRWGQLVRRCF